MHYLTTSTVESKILRLKDPAVLACTKEQILNRFTLNRLKEIKAVSKSYQAFYGFIYNATQRGPRNSTFVFLKIACILAYNSYQGSFKDNYNGKKFLVNPPESWGGTLIRFRITGVLSAKGGRIMLKYIDLINKCLRAIDLPSVFITYEGYGNIVITLHIDRAIQGHNDLKMYYLVWYFPELVKVIQNIIRIKMLDNLGAYNESTPVENN